MHQKAHAYQKLFQNEREAPDMVIKYGKDRHNMYLIRPKIQITYAAV